MADSKDSRNAPQWPVDPTKVAPPTKRPAASPPQEEEPSASGRVVHDERGNAVWDWAKKTGRIALDSTSALLKRLDFKGLKVEGESDEKDEKEAKPGADNSRDAGGGYDPYNQPTSGKKTRTHLPPLKRK